MSATCRRLLSSETVSRVFFRVRFSAPDVSACHLLGLSRTSPPFTLAMSDVQTDAATLTCKLCRRALPVGSNGRLHGKHWTCRHCLNMETLLHRHLGPANQQGWSVESKADFFKKAATADLTTGSHSWETVRTWVIETQTVRETKEQENQVKSKSLPLSVWLQKGYVKEDALKYPVEDDPHLGPLYSVPVKSCTLREAKARVTEEIFSRERAARQTSRKRKAPAGEDTVPEEAWDVVTPVPAKGHPCGKASAKAAAKKAAAKGEKDASAKTLEKERAKQEKINDRISTFSAKATGPLVKATKACRALLGPATKLNLGEDAAQSLRQAIERGEAWNKEAVNAQSLVERIKGTGAKVEELSFSPQDLKDYSKTTADLLKELRARVKAEKAKATKAAKEAAENK